MQHLESLSRYLGPNTIPTNYRKFHYVGFPSHRVDLTNSIKKDPRSAGSYLTLRGICSTDSAPAALCVHI